nr:e3 ubiquitin-protein ligase ring1-like [Quercus suber]
MIPNFSPRLSYSRFNDEATNHGSRHEREPTDRGWLSDRGASFSSSRLPSSFSRFSDDVSSDDDEHAPPNLFDHDHVPSRFSDDREHVSSLFDDDEHAPPSLFDHEHVPSRLHELSLFSDDDEHVPSRFSNGHDHAHVPSQFRDDHEHEPIYRGSVSPNFSLFDSEEDASTSANYDELVKNGSFVVGSSQQKQGFDVGFYCSICLEEPQAGDKLIRMNCSHIYHQDCLLPWLQMHNTCPNCRSKLDQQ